MRSISNGRAGAAVRVAGCGDVRVPPRMCTYHPLVVGKGAVLNFEEPLFLKYIGIYTNSSCLCFDLGPFPIAVNLSTK